MRGEGNWRDLVPELLALEPSHCFLRGNLAFSLRSPTCYMQLVSLACGISSTFAI